MTTRPSVREQNDSRYNIRVLDRAIHILSLLADGRPRTVNEISEELDLSPSTTFRLLATLGQYSYVKKDEVSSVYSLGLACLELAHAYQASDDLRKTALPVLEALRDDVKETIHLAVMDQMEVVYIEKLSGLHAIGLMGSRVGGRSPGYCTGLGKVLLAYQKPEQVRAYYRDRSLRGFTPTTITDIDALLKHLEQVRAQGYAFDAGEHEPEVHCVAAPIFDRAARVVAALSISGPSNRVGVAPTKLEMIDKAVQAAMSISHQLGYSGNQH